MLGINDLESFVKTDDFLRGAESIADPYFANCPTAVSAVPDQILASTPTIPVFIAKSFIITFVSQSRIG